MNIIFYIAITILLIISLCLCIYSDENEITIPSWVMFVLSLVALVGHICTRELSDDVKVLQQHIDHDKTRVIKENGKTKELYVTIDGEEYHFIFEEDKK